MKVILLEDIKRLGKKGDVVQVADGYARNYLLPRQLAVEATEGRLKKLAKNQAVLANKKHQEEEKAKELAVRLNGMLVKVYTKAGEGGRLFGSVNNKDIAEALWQEHGIKIDRRKIILKNPIKQLGTYLLPVKLYPLVEAYINVAVLAEQNITMDGK